MLNTSISAMPKAKVITNALGDMPNNFNLGLFIFIGILAGAVVYCLLQRAVLDTSGLQAPLNNSACLLCLSNLLWNHGEVLVVGIHG